MKARKFFAAAFVALLIISLSISLFACNGGTLEEVLNSDTTLGNALKNFFATSNVSFKYTSEDVETVTVVDAQAKNSSKTSSADMTYKLFSNNLYAENNMGYGESLFAFSPRNVFYRGMPTDPWTDYSQNLSLQSTVEYLFEHNIYPTLEEGEVLTIQKLFGTNPQVSSIFANANFTIKKVENNTYYLEDVSKTYTRAEGLKYIGATDEVLKKNNVTINTLDISVTFSSISFTIEDNKVTKVCFIGTVNADIDMSKGEERDHRIGVATSNCVYEFYDYGTTTLLCDPTKSSSEVTKEVWDAQVDQFTFANMTNYTGTGIGFTYEEKAGNTIEASIRCMVNPNYIYTYQTNPVSAKDNAYYAISSIDDTKITYTRYLASYLSTEGELYKVPGGSEYYKQEETTDLIDNPTSVAFSAIQFAALIASQLDFDNFTYVEDHYEQATPIQITDGPELSNIKVYFNNSLLTKITYTSTIGTDETEVTISFGYGFTLLPLTKVEADTTT